MHPRGFTLLEVMLTIAILGSIFLLSARGLSALQRSFAAQAVDREITSIVSTAARRARIGTHGSAWGVYIPYDNLSRSATTVTVFSGTSYATRDTAYDQIYTINDDAKFTSVDFSGVATNTGNDHEITFGLLTGATAQYGSVVIEWYGQTRTITIDADGFAVRSPL